MKRPWVLGLISIALAITAGARGHWTLAGLPFLVVAWRAASPAVGQVLEIVARDFTRLQGRPLITAVANRLG